MDRNYKKLSSHGSINIPVAMRREMGLQGGDPMEVSMKDGIVTVTPYTPRCLFCETAEGVHRFMGKGICESCAKAVMEKISREG
ncbi:MAG: AbrB/MazE/SpoVT family DNA-binding domain-containing protein [Roseburia sp.]|nr:AbrB/MazE/SpoVT family DNA-binding domain-containing protein [Roseburia sp.]